MISTQFGDFASRRYVAPTLAPEQTIEKVVIERDIKAADTVWKPAMPKTTQQVKLTILQITDVYTLENLASFKTLVETARHSAATDTSSKVISMLTGDFLSPYLLSSLDRGAGMMNALNRMNMDYLTWGNHEADIDHKTVCKHVRNFKGTWLNTNMRDHEAMEYQKEFDIIELTSDDGTNKRRVGLVAVLSNDPNLYEQFEEPGAFGGATIDDPWETLRHYKAMLEAEPYNCDVVIPLEHLYVPDNYKTCKEFDFPVILSGHDHHVVDEVVDGTRLIKPGQDAVQATALELIWDDAKAPGDKPTVCAQFVQCNEYPPDLTMQEQNERAYDVLLPLRNTELARVAKSFQPLSSVNSRGCVCSMGQYICTRLRASMNSSRRRNRKVDAAILMGGNIRAGTDYPMGSFFSLEALESEIKPEEEVGVVFMPGWLISKGIQVTHLGDPIPGWFQYDSGIIQDPETKEVTHIDGQPLDPEKIYRVATKIEDLTNGQSPPLTEYFEAHPELLPHQGGRVNIQAELMGFFSKNIWRKIWEGTTPRDEDGDIAAIYEMYGPESEELLQERMKKLDLDGDGEISIEEIHAALRDIAKMSVDDQSLVLAEFIQNYADRNGDGKVTVEDLGIFAQQMPYIR